MPLMGLRPNSIIYYLLDCNGVRAAMETAAEKQTKNLYLIELWLMAMTFAIRPSFVHPALCARLSILIFAPKINVSCRWQCHIAFTSIWIRSDDTVPKMPKRWLWAFRQLNSNGETAKISVLHSRRESTAPREKKSLVCLISLQLHMFRWIHSTRNESLIVLVDSQNRNKFRFVNRFVVVVVAISIIVSQSIIFAINLPHSNHHFIYIFLPFSFLFASAGSCLPHKYINACKNEHASFLRPHLCGGVSARNK